MNRHLKTIVIAPVTSQSKNYPIRIEIDLAGIGNWIAVDLIRTIDKTRVIRKISELSEKEIILLKRKIKETFVE